MPIGTDVRRMTSVVSTSDAARELALAGAVHGTAVLAEEQTGGRGTKGRSWHSPRGLGLYASFVLREPAGGPVPLLHLVPLAAGLAASDAVLDAAGAAVGLKWPNDLVVSGKKLGGVLCESVSGGAGGAFAVVGIGINVGHSAGDFPEALRSSATSLRLIGAWPADTEPLFAALCRALDSWYNALARGDKGSVLRTFEARMAYPRGRRVRVTAAGEIFTGTCRGLDEAGRLVVDRGGEDGLVALDAVLDLREA